MKEKKKFDWKIIIYLVVIVFFSIQIYNRHFNIKKIKAEREIKETIKDFATKYESYELRTKFLEYKTDNNSLVNAFVIEMGMGKHGISTIGVNCEDKMFAMAPQISTIEKENISKAFKTISDEIFNHIVSNLDSIPEFDGNYQKPQKGFYKLYVSTKDKILMKKIPYIPSNEFDKKISKGFLELWSKKEN